MPVVVVPWRPDGGLRDAIWARLKARHVAAGRTVIEGTCVGPWCKATAVADALSRTDAERFAIHDADVWTEGLDKAFAAEGPWAIPHRLLYRLAAGQHIPTTDRAGLDQAPYRGFEGGGVLVIDRTVYEDCPLDPRFLGWGQEDQALAASLRCLHGAPWRGEADLWHWWHEPQARRSRSTGSARNAALYRRYWSARRSPERMRALIEEGRTWESSSTTPA